MSMSPPPPPPPMGNPPSEWSPPPVSDSVAPAPRRSVTPYIAAFGAVVILIAAGFGGYLFLHRAAGNSVLQMTPGDSAIYASISLQAGGSQNAEAKALFDKFP